MGATGAADPGGQDPRTTAPDGHARGDERDLLSVADRLPLALSAARSVSAALDRLQHFPQVPARRRVGADLGEVHTALREQLDREASPTAAIIDSQSLKAAEKGGESRGEKDAVGYDAGKKVKGRKVHALVDVEGLPLRVVVHSAGIQDRDGAGLVLDKIRHRFPWLELVWADAGYNAHQVKDAVASFPASRSRSSSAPTT